MDFAELAGEWEKKLNRSFIHQHVNHEGDPELLTFEAPSWEVLFTQLMSEMDEMQHTLLDALREAAFCQEATTEDAE